jgi:hypothetical protein
MDIVDLHSHTDEVLDISRDKPEQKSGPKDDDCDEWLKAATFVYTNNRE